MRGPPGILEEFADLLRAEDVGIADVAVGERSRRTPEVVASGEGPRGAAEPTGKAPQGPGQAADAVEVDGLAVDAVATEQLIGSLA